MENEKRLNGLSLLIEQTKKDLENEFQKRMLNKEVAVENINKIVDTRLTYGDRIADKVAEIGGSWAFIIAFFAFIVAWMISNTFILATRAYDNYPYILLNLVLSCLAAIQAPIIMMSQNRHAKKDRLEADEDYKTNARSEIQIQELNAKLDLFMELFIKMNFETKEDQLKKINESLNEIHDHLHNQNKK
ncbi:MAG: DUF1003 domain-containing protein [Ignavibacteriales bacterium]|nr:DUF1003 domain-containing protein [Ignavibacteriales bacterium]